MATDTCSDGMLSIDLSELPEEVTDYAFDQYEHRIQEAEEKFTDAYFTREMVGLRYESQSVELIKTPVTIAIEEAVMEKVSDIEWEVKHGERDDYTESDVAALRQTAVSVFS